VDDARPLLRLCRSPKSLPATLATELFRDSDPWPMKSRFIIGGVAV
jgi:hypothetical protein